MSAKRLPIDRERDGLAQLVALQPRGTRIAGKRARLQVEPQAVRDEADAQIVQRDASRVGRALERRVGFGSDRRFHGVDLPGLEPQQLRVLVREDLDGETIEVRQRAAVRCLAKIARVPIEDQALARHVGAEHERAEADDVRRRRGDVPCVPELAGVERRFQLVARQDDRLSSRRTPAANGSAKTISTVWGSMAVTRSLLPLAVSESARLLAVFSS